MKYAFVIGSNAFVVPHGVISYSGNEGSKVILRVKSIYHDTEAGSHLSVDLDIKDAHGNPVKVNDNQAEYGAGHTIKAERDNVKVFDGHGALVIHVHQLDDVTAMSLQLNIVAELEVNAPIAVIRISGEFMVEGLHIIGENEKLFIDDDAWATSALAGNSLQFTPAGLVI